LTFLKTSNIDFNGLFLLESLYYEGDSFLKKVYKLPSLEDFNMSVSFNGLLSNDYIVEDPQDNLKHIISVKGKKFIEELLKIKEGVTATSIVEYSDNTNECFDEWWKTYPLKTGWESEDGKTKFIGSRVLKNLNKADAKKKYLKLLNQGFLHKDLIGALKYEIKLKKLDSIKKNTNQMDFFKGMESYFNQERYLIFIDLYKENPNFVSEGEKISRKSNVTDI
jgi:hypothetical protein